MSLVLRRALQAVLVVLTMDVVLFGAAGRIDWAGAWALTIVYGVFLVAVAIWATRHAPGLLEERGHVAANVKAWDKAIAAAYAVLLVGLLVTAALDAGRFRLSAVPFALQVGGLVASCLAGAVIWQTMVANAFLSRWARIQDDRGHTVVEGGPYSHVRHPMYAAIMLLMVALALTLGSWWALVPAALIDVLYVIRTWLEDRMLRDELPGYAAYATRVRYRLVPGLW